MLIENLFEFDVLSYDNQHLEALVTLHAQNEIYKGHFPGRPVTPGVVQIQLVKELLETTLHQKIELNTIGRCKFLAVLDPDKTPEIHVSVTITRQHNLIKVNALGKTETESYFKFSASFR